MAIFIDDGWYRWKDIKPHVPWGQSTHHKFIREGKLPKGEHLSDNVVAWRGRVLNKALARLPYHSPQVRIPGARSRRTTRGED